MVGGAPPGCLVTLVRLFHSHLTLRYIFSQINYYQVLGTYLARTSIGILPWYTVPGHTYIPGTGMYGNDSVPVAVASNFMYLYEYKQVNKDSVA